MTENFLFLKPLHPFADRLKIGRLSIRTADIILHDLNAELPSFFVSLAQLLHQGVVLHIPFVLHLDLAVHNLRVVKSHGA